MRKRNNSRRRRHVGRSGAKALAAATAVAGGTHAYADAIKFVNNGEFEWSVCRETVGLDVTLPAGAQDGQPSPSIFDQYRTCEPCTYYDTIILNATEAGGWVRKPTCYYNNAPVLAKLSGGKRIKEELGRLFWRSDAVMYCDYDCPNTWLIPSSGYIGIRFQTDDGFHYGWIRVAFTDKENPHLAALAWGYETEPDTPIRAGEGEVRSCSGNETLALRCRASRNGSKIKATLKKAEPGLSITFRLDDDPDTDQKGAVNRRGKSKAKFRNVSPGDHSVEVLECGLRKDVSCKP